MRYVDGEQSHPGDQSRWGRFDALQERNRELLHQMLEKASAPTPARTPIDEKIGDYYAACMDEAGINAKGIAPLKPDLDRIAAIKDKAGVTAVVTQDVPFRRGAVLPIQFVSPTRRNSTQMIGDLDQGGPRTPGPRLLPENGRESPPRFASSTSPTFRRCSSSWAQPRRMRPKNAQQVMDLETTLAKGSLDRVSRRDPEKLTHKMSIKALGRLGPDFRLERILQRRRRPEVHGLERGRSGLHEVHGTVISGSSLDAIKSYLTWNVVHDSASVLPAPFEQETFNFFSKTLRGTKEMRPRWETLRRSDRSAVAGRARTQVRRNHARRRRPASHTRNGRERSKNRWATSSPRSTG
jgi:endothelin-converting enzyme/putative endopeptidase